MAYYVILLVYHVILCYIILACEGLRLELTLPPKRKPAVRPFCKANISCASILRVEFAGELPVS